MRALGAGAAAVGGAVGLTIGMRSDDPAVSRQLEQEDAEREAVEKFIDRFVPAG